MKTFEELTAYVSDKAKQYLSETGTVVEAYPQSIVDFVVEYAALCCNFPKSFSEEKKLSVLSMHKNSLAMACNDIFAKIGAEGQTGHNENSISRSYDSSWITPKLLSKLPNYATLIT